MSFSWFVYSPMTSQEAESVLEQCDDAIGAYFDAHVDRDDQFGFMDVIGKIPTIEEIEKAHRKAKQELDPEAKKLHSRCRSVVQIEKPGSLETDRLQVSLLKFLLERMGDSLFDWGTGLVELGVSALKSLEKHEALDDFPPEQSFSDEVEDEPDEEETPQEGITESLVILECFERLSIISRLDLKRLFDKLPGQQQAYLELIVEGGPISFIKAASEMDTSVDQLTNLCEEVAKRLGSLLRELSE